MHIGILAVQGAFREHAQVLKTLNADYSEIRQKKDLFSKPIDGLILPGGESTVMGKLIVELEMFGPLQEMIRSGTPVFGTCAGLILLARKIANDSKVHLGTMDIVAKRNAYGRQLGSFYTSDTFIGIGEIPMTFIRAPYIQEAAETVKILSEVDGHIVAAQQDNMLVTAFHPELTDSLKVHQYFLEQIVSKNHLAR